MIYIPGQNSESFGNQFPQLLCRDRLVLDGLSHFVGDYACSGSFELRRHHVLLIGKWNVLNMSCDRMESAHKMTKAVPEKNGLSKTVLADSSASINWVRFQGYQISALSRR